MVADSWVSSRIKNHFSHIFLLISIHSIGILYLKNIGSNDDEYFSYGIQDKLNLELKSISGISTPSIQEVVKYKENNFPISEIGRRLKVNNIIDGTSL